MIMLKRIIKPLVPARLHSAFISWLHQPKPRRIRWGNLRRVTPVSRVFGADRGQPIDRYYIESFLKESAEDIRGCVLEIGDPAYTLRYGGERVTHSEVLHAQAGNDQATLVGDLATGEGIPEAKFDCMILTQTFPFIHDVGAAIQNSYKALRPGGVLLATVSGISQISRYDMDRWGDYWRFTDASCQRLFGDVFGEEHVTIRTHGNVLSACAFLQGLATRELKQSALDETDPDYQMLITIRAEKDGSQANG